MDPASPIPDFAAFYGQEIAALLLGLVFVFLYRQSRVVYFGLWSIAWLLRFLAGHPAKVFTRETLRAPASLPASRIGAPSCD